jgi:hypothetical protein
MPLLLQNFLAGFPAAPARLVERVGRCHAAAFDLNPVSPADERFP